MTWSCWPCRTGSIWPWAGNALRGLLADGGTLADLKGELGEAADWTL